MGKGLLHHLYHIGLLMPERHLVTHHLVLNGVLQRSVQQHLHCFSLDKTHLHDALAEATVARHLDDDAFFACFQL